MTCETCGRELITIHEEDVGLCEDCDFAINYDQRDEADLIGQQALDEGER